MQELDNEEERKPLNITLLDAYSFPYTHFLKNSDSSSISSSSSSSSSSFSTSIVGNQTLAYFIGRTFLFLTKCGLIY
jgi:hypothetical protein